jgi:two-component system response regulator PilR (NtrC family)
MARILVVDDELSMREFLQILLAKQGHSVVTSSRTSW